MGIRLTESEFNRLTNQNAASRQFQNNKYHNKRICINGIKFDSQCEYERYAELKLLERTNVISNLRYHDKSDVIILLEDPPVKYEPDFCYIDNTTGKLVIEDTKGVQTKEFIIKKKMILAKIKSGELNASFVISKKQNGKFIVIPQ